MGLALAWGVVVVGFVGSGGLGGVLDEGPCEVEALRRDDVRGFTRSSSWWPPESRCELELENGQTVVTRHPGRSTWWVAAAALAAPIALPAPMLRRRRRRSGPLK